MSTGPQIDPQHLGKYELHERLGQGSMAEVWKAYDTELQRYVAIKFLHVNLQSDPDFVTRFQREAQVIISLRYPNIVQCYDFSISQHEARSNPTYLVMDYVEGETLASYIHNTAHKGTFLPVADIVRLCTPIGMAVEYAHQHGVVHSNLKSGNILLDKHNTWSNAMGEPMITDFGIAKLMGATTGGTSGWLIGTPLYISPEQILGSPANERSDIYSLGIMLYEICTGTLPFQGSNPAAIMMQHVNTIPASPALINPNLPPALAEVIMHCIAKDPSARFSRASSLVTALTQASRQDEKEVSNRHVGESVDMPTIRSTRLTPLPAAMTPPASMPSFPGISGTWPPSPSAISGSSGQGVSQHMTPVHGADLASSPARSAVDRPLVGSSQPYPVAQTGGPTIAMPPTFTPGLSASNLPAGTFVQPSAPASTQKPRRRGMLIALVVLLILVLVGSSLGAYFAFFSKGNTPTGPLMVGHAYFISSGLLSPDSRQGITDQLQISIANIPPPQTGKMYYAWLLNDKTQDFQNSQPTLLGALTVNNGTIELSFQGDTVHSNLLAINSRFLITEEDAAAPPINPSLDPATWRYYAEFSQKKPNPADPKSYSLVDHIRHLLADDPKVKAAGLTGGLDIWLYRNTQKVLEWAGSARDFWKNQDAGSADFIRRQLTRIIDYLDGTTYAQRDLPGQGLLVDPTIAKIGLLTFDPLTQNPPGYLYHIGKHLREMIQLPAITAEQKALAIQINQAINQVNIWFQTMHDEVLRVYHMTDTQLFGSDGRTLLDDVAALANKAFAGQINPNAQVTDGVVQIHYNIQKMATFDISACTASNPCAL